MTPAEVGDRAHESLRAAIAIACGVPVGHVSDLRPVAGGDVSRALTARVDGRRVFCKHLDPPVPGLLAAEADGLRWLDVPEGPRVPDVLGLHDDEGELLAPSSAGLPSVLVLEHLIPAPPAADHDELLGRGLAAIHGAGAPSFGAPWPSFIGPLQQPRSLAEADDHPGAAAGAWDVDFLVRCRWWPIARIADDRGTLPDGTLAALERLSAVAVDRLGPPEPPARLHGDLWAGNAITDQHGHPVLIDPSAHGGNREVDLAMMRLFGGFGSRVFAAYEEVLPLAEGHEDRVALHQLHPLLVHAALFGGGYGRRARGIIDRHT